MPDELTRTGRGSRVPLAQVLAVVALFAVVGAVAGWVWFQLWDAPPGVVTDHAWYPDPYMPGQRADFDGVALYVLVALAAGVLGGAVCALWLARSEVATLAAVAVGSCLAAWVMALVGTGLGPADPEQLARTAEDGTRLSGDLALTGLSPYVALPAGALFAVLVVFLSTLGRPRLPQQPTPTSPSGFPGAPGR